MKNKGSAIKWTKRLKIAVASVATAFAVAFGGAAAAIGVSVAARNARLGGNLAGSVADNTQTSVTVGQTIEIATASDWATVIAAESSATSYAEAKLTANITADSTTHLFGEGTEATGAYFNGALNVPAGKYIVLDLNGYTVNRGLTEAVEGGSVITNYGNLVVRDTSTKANGKITGANNTERGGGVQTSGASFILQSGNICDNNAKGGAGISANGKAKVTVEGGSIENNYCIDNAFGGGIFLCDQSVCELSGGVIKGNTANQGGGIYYNSSNLIISGGKIIENHGNAGNGIFVNSGNFTMTGGEISNNVGGYWTGGIEFYYIKTAVISGGKISGNSAQYCGGINLGYNGNVIIKGDVEISNNTSTKYYGGGVSISTDKANRALGSITIGEEGEENCNVKIIKNTAATHGGGVYSHAKGKIIINGGTISNNTATNNGGGIYSSATGELNEDGTIKTYGLTIRGGEISNNTALSGGGLYFYNNSTTKIDGGEVSDNNAPAGNGGGFYAAAGSVIDLVSGSISGNKARQGGAISTYGATLNVLSGFEISNNTAEGYAGAMFINGPSTVTIDGGTISGNISECSIAEYTTGGGAIYMQNKDAKVTVKSGTLISNNVSVTDGGGVYVSSGTFNMEGGTLTDNTAGGDGGGIYVLSSNSVTISDAEIKNNTCSRFGGGIRIAYGLTAKPVLNNVTVTGNTSGSLGGGVYVGSTTTLKGKIDISGNFLKEPPGNLVKNNAYIATGGPFSYAIADITSGSKIGVNSSSERELHVDPTASMSKITWSADNSLWKIGTTPSGDNTTIKLVKNVPEGITDSNAGLWNYAAQASSDTNPIVVDLRADWTWGANSATGFGYSGAGFTSAGNLLVPAGKNIVLNLNTYNIDRAAGATAVVNGHIFEVYGTLTIIGSGNITGANNNDFGGAFIVRNGGKLVISGGTITANKAVGGGAAICVNSKAADAAKGGTVIINGGTISNNTISNADSNGKQSGTIHIGGSGVFEMHGGTIGGTEGAGNKLTGSDSYGGGIYATSATVTIDGGTITGNEATRGGGVYIAGTCTAEIGGNVLIHSNNATYGAGVFTATAITISGGKIYSNTASSQGGGLFAAANDVKMTGGEIYSNSVSATTGATNGGGGVYITGTFTMEGGRIYDNTTTVADANNYIQGSEVFVAKTFTMKGGLIRVNPNTEKSQSGVYVPANATFNFEGGTISRSVLTTGSKNYARAIVLTGGTVNMSGTAEVAMGVSGERSVIIINSGTFNMTGGSVHGISATGSARAIDVDGGTLKISGTAEIYDNTTSSNGGAISVASGGTLEITGGKIHDNTATTYGGAIYSDGGTLKISGTAEIYNNTAKYGAIFVKGGTLEMKGGEIYGNTATISGGGIYGDVDATMTVSGGKIYQNNANTKNMGGGIFMASGILTLTGGEIYENTAGYGGGVFAGGTVVLGAKAADGKLSGNVKIYNNRQISGGGQYAHAGGGMYINGATSSLTIYGGEITGNVSQNSGGGVYVSSAPTEIYGGTISGNTAVAGGGIVFSSGTHVIYNCTISDNVATVQSATGGSGGMVISSGSNVTIYGGEISGNSASNGAGIHNSGTLNLGTAEKASTVVISGNTAEATGGGIYSTGTVNMYGGEISGNNARNGAGVYVNSGTFTMASGSISGSNSTKDGGGVYLNDGSFTMNGGTIGGETEADANESAEYGGGVYVNGGTFTMTDGTISGNKAINGGGVYVYNSTGTFAISGGEISGNVASTKGGGVCVSLGTLKVSGTAKITDNTLEDGETANNVYLPAGKTITVSGALTGTEKIGVTTETKPTDSAVVFTGSHSSITTATARAAFFSDDEQYAVGAQNNTAILVSTLSVTVTATAELGGEELVLRVDKNSPVTYTVTYSADKATATVTFKFTQGGDTNVTKAMELEVGAGYRPSLYLTSAASSELLSGESLFASVARALTVGVKKVERTDTQYKVYYLFEHQNAEGEWVYASTTDADALDNAAHLSSATPEVRLANAVGKTGAKATVLSDGNLLTLISGTSISEDYFATFEYDATATVIPNIAGDDSTVVYVYFKLHTHTVTFDLNGWSTTEFSASDFIYELKNGETYNKPVEDSAMDARAAYNFLGWFTEPVEIGISETLTATPVDFTNDLTAEGDITYYAGWQLVGYQLILHYERAQNDSTPNIYTYGTGSKAGTLAVSGIPGHNTEYFEYTDDGNPDSFPPYNAQFRILEPTAEGFEFAGWYNAAGTRVRYVYRNTENNVELWARWKPATYSVSFNANRGSISQNDSIGSYVNFEEYGTLPVATRSGYTFEGWFLTKEAADACKSEDDKEGNPDYVTEDTTVVLHGATTLYACWFPDQYSITYSEPTSGGSLGRLYIDKKDGKGFQLWRPAVDKVDYGATIAIQVRLAPDVSGYNITIRQNNSAIGNGSTLIVRNNIAITATFTEITYNIRYSYNGGGAVNNDESGFIKQFTANNAGNLPNEDVVRAGYEFKGWLLQNQDYEAGSALYTLDDLRQYLSDSEGALRNVILYAHWEAATLNVFLHKNFNGTDTNPDSVQGKTGDTITLHSPSLGGEADDNYILLGWSTSPDSTNIAVAVDTDESSETFGQGLYTVKAENYTSDWTKSKVNNLYAVWHVKGAQTLIMSTSLENGATETVYNGKAFNITARPLITYSEKDTTLELHYEWVKDGDVIETVERTADDFNGDKNAWLTVTLPVSRVSQSGTYTCNLTVSGSTVTGETMSMTSGSITVTIDKAVFADLRLSNSLENEYTGNAFGHYVEYKNASGTWTQARPSSGNKAAMIVGSDRIEVEYAYAKGDTAVNSIVNAGNYTVTAKFTMPANSNYEDIGDMTCLFTVLPVNIDEVTYTLYSLDANGVWQTVNGFRGTFTGREYKVLVTSGDIKGDDDVEIVITENVATNAGDYTATLTGLLGGADAANYTFHISDNITRSFTIAKAEHNLSKIAFKDVTAVYDGEMHETFLTYNGNKVNDGEVIVIDGFNLTVNYTMTYVAVNAFNYANDSKNGGDAAGVYTVTVTLTDDAANVNNFVAVEAMERTVTVEQENFFNVYDREEMLGEFKMASVGYTTDASKYPKPVIDGADGEMSFNSDKFTVTYTYEYYRSNSYWTIFEGNAAALAGFAGLKDPGSYRLTAHIAFAGGSDANEALRNNYEEVGDITITYSIAAGTVTDIVITLDESVEFFYGEEFDKSAIQNINIQYLDAGSRDATEDEINESVIYDGTEGTKLFTTFDRVGEYKVRISFYGEERELTLNVKQKISEIEEWQYKLTTEGEGAWKEIPADGVEYSPAGFNFRAKFACVNTDGEETYAYATATATGNVLAVRANPYTLTAAGTSGNYVLAAGNGNALTGSVTVIKNTSVTVKWYYNNVEIGEDTLVYAGASHNFASGITVKYSIDGGAEQPLNWDLKNGSGNPVIRNAGEYTLVAVQGSEVPNYALQGLETTIKVNPAPLSGVSYVIEYQSGSGWTNLATENYSLEYKGAAYVLKLTVSGAVSTEINIEATLDGEKTAIRNAGVYQLVCGAANYVIDEDLPTLEITKKEISINWSYKNNVQFYTYNGAEQSVTGVATGTVGGETDILTFAGNKQTNADENYIAFADLKTSDTPNLDFANNYVILDGSDTFDWVIRKLAFKVNDWTDETIKFTYTGSVQSPSAENNNIFAKDKEHINVILTYKVGDISVNPTDVVAVDTYTATATLAAAVGGDANIVENYSFENVTCEFVIEKATPAFTRIDYTEYKDGVGINVAYRNSPDGLREDKVVAVFSGAEVDGRFVFVDGEGNVIEGKNVNLSTLGRNTFKVKFIPEDTKSYNEAEGTISVQINADSSKSGAGSLIVDAAKHGLYTMNSTVVISEANTKVYRVFSSYYYDEEAGRAFGKRELVDNADLEFKINSQDADGYQVTASDFADGETSGNLTLNVVLKNSSGRIFGDAKLAISKEEPLSIRLVAGTLEATWYEDQTFDYSKASFVVVYASGETSLPASQVACDVTRFTAADAAAGTKTVTFSFGGKTTETEVTVLARKTLSAEAYRGQTVKVLGDGTNPVTDWKNYCAIVNFETADGQSVAADTIENLVVNYTLKLNGQRVDNPVRMGVKYTVEVSFTLNDKRFKSNIASISFSLEVTNVAYVVDFDKPAETTLTYTGNDLILPRVTINGVTDIDGNPVSGTVRPEYEIVFKGNTVTAVKDAGEYTVTVKFMFNGDEIGTAEYKVTVGKAENAVESFTVGSILVGGTVAPKAEFKFGGTNGIIFMYSKNGADGTYSQVVPTTAGEYWVYAVMNGTDNYLRAESKPARFTINNVSVASENKVESDAVVEISDNTNGIEYGIAIDAEKAESNSGVSIKKQNTLENYDLTVVLGADPTTIKNAVSVKLLISEELKGRTDLNVYFVDGKGNAKNMNAKVSEDGKYLEFTASNLGSGKLVVTFAQPGQPVGLISAVSVLGAVAVAGVIACIVVFAKKRRKSK